MHYKKTDKGWVLEPYKQHNKAHFIKRLKDGLAAADDIVIRKKACNLTRDMVVRLLDRGYKQIPSSHPEYEAYEDKRSIPENPYIHYLRYIRKGENPIIISQSNYHGKRDKEDNYSASISFCIHDLSVHVYPFSQQNQQMTQQELVGYQRQAEQLVWSFLVKPKQ